MMERSLAGERQNITTMERAQGVILCVLLVLDPFSFRQILYTIPPAKLNVFYEWQGIVVFWADYFLVAFIAVTLLRLTLEPTYRTQLLTTARLILGRFGGVFWLLWLAWVELGAFWANEPLLVHYTTLQISAGLLMALVVAGLVVHGMERDIFWILAMSAAAESILAVLETLNHGPIGLFGLGELPGNWTVPGGIYRGSGLTVNPNNLAGYLMLGLFACIMLLRDSEGKVRLQLEPAFLGVLISAGLVSSMSRSAILGLAIGLTPVMVVLIYQLQNRSVRILAIAAIVLGVIAVAGLALVFGAQNRLWIRDFQIENTDAVLARAPIFGVGAGNLGLELYRDNPWAEPFLLPVHNMYWMQWAEIGIPGTLLFIAAIARIFTGLRAWRHFGVFVWSCCFLTICITMLFDYYFWGDNRSRDLMFWVIGTWWGLAFRAGLGAPVRAAEPEPAQSPGMVTQPEI